MTPIRVERVDASSDVVLLLVLLLIDDRTVRNNSGILKKHPSERISMGMFDDGTQVPKRFDGLNTFSDSLFLLKLDGGARYFAHLRADQRSV